MTVTSPDGRGKSNLTVVGTTSLKQLLRKACVNLKMVDNEDSPETDRYGLKHGRHILDLSLQVRLSGLPAGAKLDLIISNTKAGMVTVALQHAGGRITGQFPSTTGLWSMLTYLEGTSSGQLRLLYEEEGIVYAPHLLILGQECVGLERLVRTTLGNIGITSGNCLIRMTHKRCECSSMEDAVSIASTALPVDTTPLLAGTRPSDDASSAPVIASTSVALSAYPTIPPLDRDIILYTPPNSSRHLPTAPNLPESHYELGEAEFRRHLAASQARIRALLDAPLVSRSKLVEKQQAELLTKHPTTRLRFRFPDQYQLEATFRSIESSADLYTFLQSSMTIPSMGIALSTGPPPKPIPTKDTPLWKLDLVPAAIINVAFTVESGRPPTSDILTDQIKSSIRRLPTIDGDLTYEALEEESPSPINHQAVPNPTRNVSPTTGLKKPGWLRL